MALPRGDLPTEIEAILIELLDTPPGNVGGPNLAAVALVRQLVRIEAAIDQLTEAVEGLTDTFGPK